jgi:hypothetical protein
LLPFASGRSSGEHTGQHEVENLDAGAFHGKVTGLLAAPLTANRHRDSHENSDLGNRLKRTSDSSYSPCSIFADLNLAAPAVSIQVGFLFRDLLHRGIRMRSPLHRLHSGARFPGPSPWSIDRYRLPKRNAGVPAEFPG